MTLAILTPCDHPPHGSWHRIGFAEAYRNHDPGPGHPESPARITAVREALERSGRLNRCVRLNPRPVSEEELLRCHSLAFIHTVIRDVAYGKPCLSTGDTGLGEHSEEVARLAAGGVIVAVREQLVPAA